MVFVHLSNSGVLYGYLSQMRVSNRKEFFNVFAKGFPPFLFFCMEANHGFPKRTRVSRNCFRILEEILEII